MFQGKGIPLTHGASARRFRRAQRGQTLVVVALLLTALIGMLGLVIDVGYAYSERRQIQNAADAAALNGARQLDAQFSNGNQNGSDKQILLSIKQYITAYNLTVNASGNVPASLQSAVYVDELGATTYGVVGTQPSTQIPTGAAGVRVVVREPWTPFVMEALGFSSFTIAASATAVSASQPNADTVFINCPPYGNNGGSATVNLTLSGGGGSNADVINGNIFVNGSAKANGGSIKVSGTFGTSGTLQGNGVTATGGISQNQPPQQFPLPDVAFPLDQNGNPNTSIYNAPSGIPAYSPSVNAYPEFDQEAYWDFYLGYDTGTLPSSYGLTPYSGNYNNGDAADLWFVVNVTPDALGNVSLSNILAQIPDVTQTNYYAAYQGHYATYFKQWVRNVYTASLLPATSYPWLHWVDIAGATASDPATWYSLTPSVAAGIFGFTAQKTSHPVNTFSSQCGYSNGCFPSGIWWALNWPAQTCSGNAGPCIDMSSLGAAWKNPSTGTVVTDAGITLLTNVELFYKSSASASIYGWGFGGSGGAHAIEKSVYYTGWGALGTFYVPRTVLYTTYAAPLPTDCSSSPPPEGLHFDGSSQSINGFVMVPYGGITFHGAGANNFNGELLAAQASFSGSGVTLTYDTTSAVKGDPGLLQ
ncbi:MAG TPA: TadE/TadG family type IV pilus assembly protein [Ktedonobacterales bacterium]|nr:TadE/TadG family type IV pilus assembly protein [Ktedonobacterales bacterium]